MWKMDDSNADYLTKYREFIESLLKTTDLDYPLPVSIAKYNIAESEIPGEVLNWCLTYLNERNCPNSLAPPLCCKVLEEIQKMAKEDPEFCGYRPYEDDYQPLKLMQKTIKKLVDVCVYYSDNAKLSTLLPPPSSTLLDPPVSVCSMKNFKRKMEDRHIAIQDLHALFNIKDCGSASYYAIFDGHNGVDAAVYSSCHLHQYLVESSHYPHNPELALKEAFKKTDDRFVDKSNKEHLNSGTTVLAALIRPDERKLYVAWLGDSQAVLVSQGKAYQLVKPHRPDEKAERDRIEEMGGFTVLHMRTWRVNGQLAVSRAIGDHKYKPFISGEPDVQVIPLTGKEEFLILASDGLWDYVPENEVVNAVYDYIQENKGDVGGISKRLIQLAKSKLSHDNVSVIVVFLSEPEPCKGGRMEASEVKHIWRDSFATKAPNGQFGHDDDSGPETDVDAVHDVLSSGFPTDAAKAKALVAQSPTTEEWPPQKFESSQREFLQTLPWTYADALKKPKPKSPESDSGCRGSTAQNKEIIIFEVPEILEDVPASKEDSNDRNSTEKPKAVGNDEKKKDELPTANPEKKSEETGNDVAEAEVDSADDSEEEWDYIPGKNNKKTEKKPQVDPTERPSDRVDEEDDMSLLNPNAAEFVPVFGAEDTVLASSPAKGAEKSLEDVKVPKMQDFLDDISKKPAELENIGLEFRVNENSINGTNAALESSKECNYDSDQSEEADDKVPQSSNPFSEDKIQHQMVSDYFNNDQSFGFKPLDPMQDSMVVLESTPSPTNQGGADLYDLLSNSDKPDLLSPIDNFSNTNNEQQKSSSSGFESESGNEIDVGSTDKCDLVAGIPHDNSVDDHPVITQQVEDYPETNPFSINTIADESLVEKSSEQSLFFGGDRFGPISSTNKPYDSSPVDNLEESKPPTFFNNESESEKKEERGGTSAPVDMVDLIYGTATADSNAAQMFASMLDFTKNFEQSISDVPNFEYSLKDDKQITQTVSDEVLEASKEVETCESIKEQDNAAPVAEDKTKDDSVESDFEIISHDDAELNHSQGMNGGVHLEEIEQPSCDNYKFGDLEPQQHTVEVHAEQSSFEQDIMSFDVRPPTDVNTESSEIASSNTIIEPSDAENKTSEDVVEQVVEITELNEEEVVQDDLASFIETKPVEIEEDFPVDSIGRQSDPSKEETAESVTITELTSADDTVASGQQDEPSGFDQIAGDVKAAVGDVLEDNSVLAAALDSKVESLETEKSLPATPSAPLSEESETVLNKDSFTISESTTLPELERMQYSNSPHDTSADDILASGQRDEPSGFNHIDDVRNDCVKSAVDEVLEESSAAPTLDSKIEMLETEELLPVTPSAPRSEDLLSDLSNKESLEVDVAKGGEPKPASLEIPGDISEEIQSENFHKQNGHIAEMSTPPSTPAPGVELDKKDGLIAAAVAAAGVASVAAAATAVSGDTKAAKPDDKTMKKPAAKPLSSARPSSAKAPTKAGTAAAPAKKSAAPSAAAKAPVSAAKPMAAKPLGAAKPLAAKPATTTTKPASPLTKTSTTTAAKPKPASAAATKAPIARSTVGATAKPPTPTTKTAPAASKAAPLAKPKTPTTATPAPIRKPTSTGTVTKTAAPVAAKKPEPSKPLAAKAVPAAKTTVATPRPTSATKPTSTAAARPTSATKPTTRPATSTTTKMAAPSAAKPAATTKPAAAKPAATPAARTSTAAKTAAGTKPSATSKAAPPKPKPAAPTVLKKPAAATDKNAKDATSKSNSPRGPIKRPVSDKAKSDAKSADKEPEKIVEPPMQEPTVSTTNGHIDVIENGVSHSDESPIDVNSCSFVEAQN